MDIRRIPRAVHRDTSSGTHPSARPPTIVELVGTSGVGKTTFLRSLRSAAGPSDAFAVVERRLSVRTQRSLRRDWLAADTSWLDLWNRHMEIKQVPHDRRLDLTGEGSKAVRDEQMLRTMQSPRPLIVDHSLTSFFRDALRSIRSTEPDLFETLMRDRMVVVCSADPVIVTQRLGNRTRLGSTRHFHVGKSDSELIAESAKASESWCEHAQWLMAAGVPVLELDLGQPFDESKRLLDHFVRSRS